MFRCLPRPAGGLVLLVLATALMVSGCGQVRAGAAALVGQQRIAVEELTQSVQAVEQAAAGSGLRLTDRSALVRGVLSQKITGALIDEAAKRNGINVSREAVQRRMAQLGGRRALQRRALRGGVAPDELRVFVRRQVAAERLVRSRGEAGGNVRRAQRAELMGYLRELARGMDITVNPRYGRFDLEQLAVVPHGSRLSTPEADTTGAGPVGVGELGRR